jgi:hypothetical protein
LASLAVSFFSKVRFSKIIVLVRLWLCFAKFAFIASVLVNHSFFGFWSKPKLRVKFSQVCGGVFFQAAGLAFIEPSNKACSGRVGVCAFYRHFSGFGLFLHLKPFPRPPTRPLTQTVSPFFAQQGINEYKFPNIKS